MNILLTGATGFIGKPLVASLQDHQLTIISRNPATAKTLLGDQHQFFADLSHLDQLNDFDAVINLAGEPIVGKRWTEKQKHIICHSRWDITQQLSQLIKNSSQAPHTFISASAIGYYGSQSSMPVDESSNFHDEFSHHICQQWEANALVAQSEKTRVCIPRIGIVLGKNGGALGKMLLPFKLGLGGPIGTGKQGMSWIHIDDLIGLIHWLLNTPSASGIYNATAPKPVSNAEFSKALGRALKRPAFIPMPLFALRLAMGEMSSLVTEGQFVIPARALAAGYRFQFTDINSALTTVV